MSTTPAPIQEPLFDTIESVIKSTSWLRWFNQVFENTRDMSISNDTYGVGWMAGTTTGPSQQAVYVEMEKRATKSSPTFTGTVTTPAIKITGGAPGAGKLLTSDADGDATWADLASPLDIGITAASTIRGKNDEVIKASTGSLSAQEMAGTIVNNYGQTGDATISLAAAAKGLSFVVMLGTTVAKYYRIDPDSGDSIYISGTTTGDGKYVGIASAAKGAAIAFSSFQTGASSWDWMASLIGGLWVAET